MTSSSALIVIFLVFGLLITTTKSVELEDDRTGLTAFITQVANRSEISWGISDYTCSWKGVTCDYFSSVIGVYLPAAGLAGEIPAHSLSMIRKLRVISLHSNALTSFPQDLDNLDELRTLYLNRNRLSGYNLVLSLLNAVGMPNLEHIDLSENELTGRLPLIQGEHFPPHLATLYLQGNKLSGPLPDSIPDSLIKFNVSNNNFTGDIPKCYFRFGKEAFSGNPNLNFSSWVSPSGDQNQGNFHGNSPSGDQNQGNFNGNSPSGDQMSSSTGYLMFMCFTVYVMFLIHR